MLSQKIAMLIFDLEIDGEEEKDTILEDAHQTAIDRIVTTYSDVISVEESESFIAFLDKAPSIDDVVDYFVQHGVSIADIES